MKKQTEFPISIKISFHKIIEQYENQIEKEQNPIVKDNLVNVFEYIKKYPELKEGIEGYDELDTYKWPIRTLLNDLFPHILTNKDIKAATIPFQDVIFNLSERFKVILQEAGPDFELEMRNMEKDKSYIFACILILNIYYKYDIDFSHPLYYDIPDKNNIIKNYKIHLNTDFVEIKPGKDVKEVSDEDVDLLLQNIDDIALWKEKFPPNSYIFEGISIMSLTDVTVEDAISELKTTLLSTPIAEENELLHFQEIFRSIYKISDLEVGFTLFNEDDFKFEKWNKDSKSFILNEKSTDDSKTAICEVSYKALIEDKLIFSISNVKHYAKTTTNNTLAKNLQEKGVKSCLLAPIANKTSFLGILELVSKRKNELNSINAIKLEGIIPYIVTAIQRNKAEFENRVKAVIQSECTSIHPSVLWIFEKEAKKFIKNQQEDGLASFRDIAFEDIHPLYGQIDIIASSEARNKAIQDDLLTQLGLLREIFEKAFKIEKLSIYEQVIFRINEFEEDIQENLNATSEQKVYNLLSKEIYPLVEHISNHYPQLENLIEVYYNRINRDSGIIYDQRKNYDECVQKINRRLARYIDAEQISAQEIYPHYFERYKTDGVEHNIYIGAALSQKPYSEVYLYNLRLWQLKVMCEMENQFYNLQKDMPLKLSAASLILVFSNTMSIRYRMDEKKFDVDGTYNARYEIIKKRIDKAFIKGTQERVTQKGKLAIVYTQSSDGKEYLRYVKYLQAKEYLGEEVEIVEMEDVQGVVGLKAIRVEVLYAPEDQPERVVTYEDFLEQIGLE